MTDLITSVLRHAIMTAASVTLIAVILLATFDVGAALELWQTTAWELIAWNAMVLAPSTAKAVVERVLGRENRVD